MHDEWLSKIFWDWFSQLLHLEVEHGFQNENLAFELLLLSNSLEELKNAYLRVVPFMPPNTTSLIQPSIRAYFKLSRPTS